MIFLKRYKNNPILKPNPDHPWENEGAFNACVVKGNNKIYHMVYRAFSTKCMQNGVEMQVSSIGYAESKDGLNFSGQRQIIEPVEGWEAYGCEDPRITYLNGKYYIFYTALSQFPFNPSGIHLAVAVTSDFITFNKYPVTPFNSKAMALFPEKIDGKYAALLTINTDFPPARIALSLFDIETDIWSPLYWEDWYENANANQIQLLRDMRDQIELGAPPLKTGKGWLVIYSYIKNYISNNKQFGIEAALLDFRNPAKILGRTNYSLLSPLKDYETKGIVKDVVFPSGALIKDNELFVYYGAADTYTCVASCDLKTLLKELSPPAS